LNILHIRLENAYARPFLGSFWVKNGGKRKLNALLSLITFILLEIPELTSYKSKRVKIGLVV